jgi:hypothetical protein
MRQMANKAYQQRVQRDLAVNEGAALQSRVKDLLRSNQQLAQQLADGVRASERKDKEKDQVIAELESQCAVAQQVAAQQCDARRRLEAAAAGSACGLELLVYAALSF